MSVELSLLKLFCDDRTAEAANHGYLGAIDNLEREVKLLFNLVNTYYKEMEGDSISQDELLGFYKLKYPSAKAKEMHMDLIAEAFASTVTPDLMKLHLDQLVEKHKATKMINKLVPVMEGEKYGVLDTIRADVDEYVELLHNPPDSMVVPVPCELTVEELIEQEIEDAGLKWHIPELTEIIGGCRRKTLGLIYAFVDSGKTSFSMAATAHFARQLVETEDIICYCGNEESAARLRLRLVQAFCNWTRKQVKERGKRAEALAQEGGISNVKIFDNITTASQIEYILGHYRPHIMFIDQATKIEPEGRGKEEGVAKLERVFSWIRKIGNIHDVAIIGVAQAVGEAEDTKYLKLSDIYGSRVSIQGALDWACGIGRKVNNPIDDDLRYLNIPKNKLHDGDGGRMPVHFNKYICHWEVN
jgi:hypothetical protein